MNSRKVALLSLTIALAMILSYVESQIPSAVAIPGVKMGLANLAVIFTLYKLGIKEAIVVSIVRVLMLAMLFGNAVSLIYSISGATLALIVMFVLKATNRFSTVGVSVAGGVMHNVGQIIAACILLETDILKYYFPFLLVSGIASGIVIGLVSAALIKRVNVRNE